MISTNEVMPRLIEACPTFLLRWQEYAADPAYDSELLYIHLWEFAQHLLSLVTRGEHAEFKQTFQVVELLLRSGDEEVRTAIREGLLEDLWSAGRVTAQDPEPFVSCYGPSALRWWAEADGFGWDACFVPDLSPALRVRWDALRTQLIAKISEPSATPARGSRIV